MTISKRELTSLVDSLREFLFITLASVYRFSNQCPKLRLDLQRQKTISLLIIIAISLNIKIDKFVYKSDLETTILAYFSSKSLNYMAINLFLQKLSILTIANFTISKRTDMTLQTSVKHLRAFSMCRAFFPDRGFENSTINFIRDVFCSIIECSGKLCLHKNTFQSVGRSDYQCRQCAFVCQIRNDLFEDQTNSFFLSFGQEVYIFKKSPLSIQDVIGDVFCPGEYCSNSEKCASPSGSVTTPKSIYGCGKCAAWIFVYKVLLMLQEHVKSTKTDKTRFFAEERRTWYPTNNC